MATTATATRATTAAPKATTAAPKATTAAPKATTAAPKATTAAPKATTAAPKATTAAPKATTSPSYTDSQVVDMLNAAHRTGVRKWQEAVDAMMTRPMSAWGAILTACQERVGSADWNRWVSGFRPEFSKHGWELATTRNARSGRGEFTFRTTDEGKAARAEKSANTRAARVAEDAKRATETAAKAASVTVNELVQAVIAACTTAGLNPVEVADGIKAACKPPRVRIPRPSQRRKTEAA